MRKREFIKAVEALSKDYTVRQGLFDVLPGILDNGAYAQLIIYYKRNQVVILNDDWQFSFSNTRSSREFERLPFSHKLWMLCAEYAMTPVSKRKDEIKFRVKMLPEDDDGWEIYLNLNKSDNHIFIDDSVNGIPNNQTIFTKSEYNKLQQKYYGWLPKFDENDPHFEFLEEK